MHWHERCRPHEQHEMVTKKGDTMKHWTKNMMMAVGAVVMAAYATPALTECEKEEEKALVIPISDINPKMKESRRK